MAERRPCTCRGYDPADPCMHGDTSEGCPRHDPHFEADDELALLANEEILPYPWEIDDDKEIPDVR